MPVIDGIKVAVISLLSLLTESERVDLINEIDRHYCIHCGYEGCDGVCRRDD